MRHLCPSCQSPIVRQRLHPVKPPRWECGQCGIQWTYEVRYEPGTLPVDPVPPQWGLGLLGRLFEPLDADRAVQEAERIMGLEPE